MKACLALLSSRRLGQVEQLSSVNADSLANIQQATTRDFPKAIGLKPEVSHAAAKLPGSPGATHRLLKVIE